jgi:predicted pyridoxine 5'-phosphate oxidase superfamily flavin-nucleotide-binding protein
MPGNTELLRVNGEACVGIAPDLLAQYPKPPRCVIAVRVAEVFCQYSRAIRQSQLWLPAR